MQFLRNNVLNHRGHFQNIRIRDSFPPTTRPSVINSHEPSQKTQQRGFPQHLAKPVRRRPPFALEQQHQRLQSAAGQQEAPRHEHLR